jgi:hypothetical protein
MFVSTPRGRIYMTDLLEDIFFTELARHLFEAMLAALTMMIDFGHQILHKNERAGFPSVQQVDGISLCRRILSRSTWPHAVRRAAQKNINSSFYYRKTFCLSPS